jgi:hypothetical protein
MIVVNDERTRISASSPADGALASLGRQKDVKVLRGHVVLVLQLEAAYIFGLPLPRPVLRQPPGVVFAGLSRVIDLVRH